MNYFHRRSISPVTAMTFCSRMAASSAVKRTFVQFLLGFVRKDCAVTSAVLLKSVLTTQAERKSARQEITGSTSDTSFLNDK